MMKSNKKQNDVPLNTTATSTVNIRYLTVDGCIDFCLKKARDDIENSETYLQIIKFLLDRKNSCNESSNPYTWNISPYTQTSPLVNCWSDRTTGGYNSNDTEVKC